MFYSNRPYGSVARVPERYPLSSSYYHELFAGDLGYRLERTFTSYPQLAGVAFKDDPLGRAGLPRPDPLVPTPSAALMLNLGYGDDNVVGYDHPQVMLFRNQTHLLEETLRSRLGVAQGQVTQDPVTGLMLTPEEKAVQRSGGTWSKIFDRDSWTNSLPVLAWLLVVELAFLLALPLSMFIFRPLPDQGIVLARVLGLLGVSYVAWIFVSLGWIEFSRTSVLLGFLVIGSLSALVLLTRWSEIKDFLVQHWRLLLIGEVLFLVAFLGFVAIRAANPDLWHPWRGGEKPMELAYFNAVIRSTSLPPFDPWFAGGYLNYYYWGYFVLGGLVRVTGILPSTAFNLAVPLFFALTVAGAYTLVYNLAEGVRRAGVAGSTREVTNPTELGDGASDPGTGPIGHGVINDLPGSGRGDPRAGPTGASAVLIVNGEGNQNRWWSWALWSPVGAGLLAGLFTAVIGNLDGIGQIVKGTWHKLADGQAFPAFDFWRSSRMLPFQENFDPTPVVFWVPDKISGAADSSPHITEFPFFTFLFADLHAHMMAIPFALLVIGLGLAMVVGLRSNGRLWTASAVIALSLALGSLWVINSWDYPSYLILVLALLSLAVYFKPGPAPARLALLAVLGVVVVALSLLAFWPFHQSYEAFNTGLEASKWRTPIDRFLGIHGLFLFIIAAFLVNRSRALLAAVAQSLVHRPGIAAVDGVGPLGLAWLKVALGIALLIAVLLAVTGFWTAVFLVVILALAGTAIWSELSTHDEAGPYATVPLVLLGMALAISIGVDLVRVEGDIGRMNTFFKYYLEVWVLLSLASAYMLWRLMVPGLVRWRWSWGKAGWLAVVVVLIGSSLIYTALGTRTRIGDRFNPGPSTLDGAAYMDQAVHREREQPIDLKWDREAIQWLQDNVNGSPVVLEAHTDQYRWGARIANYTGLPTVLGWPWHQIQQRLPYESSIRERGAHIREMYDTTDVQRAETLMQRYKVKLIIVGELERIHYDQAGLEKFSTMAKEGLMEQVFLNQGVAIYQAK